MELIDRDAVIKQIAETQDKVSSGIEDVTFYRAIKIIRNAPAVNRWIPCSDRLPEDRDDVLTYDVDGNVRKCEYDAEFKKFRPEFTYYYAMDASYVTHWMPLPEPPEKE